MIPWRSLDSTTRAAVIATAGTLFFLIIPPLAVLCALVAVVSGARAFWRSRARGDANPTAQWCLMISGVLLVLLVTGNLLYASRT